MKNNLKKKLLASVLALGVTSAMAAPGAYISAEGGVATITGSDLDVGYGPAGRVAGGYLFGDEHFNAGFELGLTGYTNMDATYNMPMYNYEYDYYYNIENDFSFSGHNVDLLAVGKYTFDNHFLLLGKIGVSYVNLDASDDVTASDDYGDEVTGHGDASSSDWRGTLAVGAGYQFTPQVAATLTVSGTSLGNNDNGNSDGNLITTMLGLTYSFA
jgi:opacity protein-like surface antigen